MGVLLRYTDDANVEINGITTFTTLETPAPWIAFAPRLFPERKEPPMLDSVLTPFALPGDPSAQSGGSGQGNHTLFAQEAEVTRLYRAWVTSRVTGTAVYVEGPAGVGKSIAIARLHEAVRSQSGRIVTTEARRVLPSPDAVARQLAQVLDDDEAVEDPIAALNRRGRAGGVMWIVEGYPAWRAVDSWFRSEIVARIGPGVLLVLEGREPLQRLWAGDLAAQARVARIAFQPWTDSTMAAYLSSRGIEPAWVEPAVAVAAGSPALAVRMADAVAADRVVAPAGTSIRIWSFLVERALHPGSRRMAWRAGFADQSLDGLVAAATLVPSFTRGLMEAMVGRDLVEQHWEAFQELPVVCTPGPGVFALPPRLRRGMMPLVEEARPWMSRQWLRRTFKWIVRADEVATGHPVREAALSAIWARCLAAHTEADPVLARIVWQTTGRPSDQVSRVRVEDADELTAAEAEVVQTEGIIPDRIVLRDVSITGRRVPGLSLLVAAILARVVPSAVISSGVVSDPSVNESDAFRNLLDGNRPTPEELVLERPVAAVRALHRLFACPMVQPAARPADLVREALVALNQPERLASTRLAAYWPGPGRPTASVLRRWIHDALASADLGEWPSGRLLLTLYYVERRGSHETLAERLNVSRATYFRSHQRALQRLADHLLGADALEI
jgi:hypothetical protein